MISRSDWSRIYSTMRVLKAMHKHHPPNLTQLKEISGGGEGLNRVIINMLLKEEILGKIPLEANRGYLTCTPKVKKYIKVFDEFVEEFSFATTG